ncbi:MAG: flagellar motor switch protein FliG [Proteobacteria bacterium]|jgi:flagellar motor switch protein FliG|nr:flagellar motor switch protein FliG [Pseudomonadota bacterium]MBK8960106.1 flagellar motor switch protein FliG [Pseudomonadota bacterium]
MADAPAQLDGAQKAAIFLMSIGEGPAAEIMKYLGPREVQKIGVAMTSLDVVSPTNVSTAIGEFIELVRSHTGIGIGNEEYIRSVLTNALGEEKASSMIDRILLGGHTKGLESLKWMDPRAIVELVRFEHPQIIAIVLSYLDSDQSAEVLSLLPENTRSDLLMRIATMDGIQPAAMKELNEMLELQLRGGAGGQQSSLGGIKCAAEILNFVDRSIEAKINEQITEADADLATKIQDLMFTFENIADIDDRGIQALLREVSTDNLVLAMKGCDDTIKDKIFKNMSSRAAEMLREDLESKGPVKLSEVEGAQKEILGIARRLADEGTISLGGSGEQMV